MFSSQAISPRLLFFFPLLSFSLSPFSSSQVDPALTAKWQYFSKLEITRELTASSPVHLPSFSTRDLLNNFAPCMQVPITTRSTTMYYCAQSRNLGWIFGKERAGIFERLTHSAKMGWWAMLDPTRLWQISRQRTGLDFNFLPVFRCLLARGWLSSYLPTEVGWISSGQTI